MQDSFILGLSMMWKLNPLLPYAATILTLAIAPNAQAVRLIPVPTITEALPTETNSVTFPPPPFIIDTMGTGNAAIQGRNISVQTSPTEATVYKFCFEYGTFSDVYNPSRMNICEEFDFDTNMFTGTYFITNPEFNSSQLPDLDFASFVMGDPDPSPPDDPTSDGLRTALSMGNNIIRVLGEDFTPLFPTLNPVGINQVFIPYLNGNNQLRGISLAWDGSWSELQTDETINGENMFIRLQQTGTVPLVPPDPTVPEPSGVFGIFLAGFSLCLMVRRP
jgi:hypothetical protein